MKSWFVMLIGIDIGGPESGPIIRCEKEFFKAKSEDRAKERAKKFWDTFYYPGAEGYTVHKADMDEIPEIEEDQMIRREYSNCEEPLPFE